MTTRAQVASKASVQKASPRPAPGRRSPWRESPASQSSVHCSAAWWGPGSPHVQARAEAALQVRTSPGRTAEH